MSDFENKWISPSSIKKEVDKARMAEQKAEEERNKKNQQLWDDLTDEEKKFFIYNKEYCWSCGKALNQSSIRRKIYFEKSTSRRDGAKRVNRTTTKYIQVNECRECYKIRMEEEKQVNNTYPFILIIITAIVFLVCGMLFDDYSVGFFAMMFLGIPAYGLSKAIAKTMAEGGSSKKEGLRSVHEIPTVKKYEKKGYSANFVLHD